MAELAPEESPSGPLLQVTGAAREGEILLSVALAFCRREHAGVCLLAKSNCLPRPREFGELRHGTAAQAAFLYDRTVGPSQDHPRRRWLSCSAWQASLISALANA